MLHSYYYCDFLESPWPQVATLLLSIKEKKTLEETPYANLQILAQDHDVIIEDPVDAANAQKILFPFAVNNQMHCFLSPLLSPSKINKVLFSLFLLDQELLIKRDMYMAPFDDHTKGFQNNPKTSSKSINYLAWFKRIKQKKKDFWAWRGIYDRLQLSQYQLTTHH